MLSTMKVMLLVSRDVILVKSKGRCVSGNTVFGVKRVRFARGAVVKIDGPEMDGGTASPLGVLSGREGTANTASECGRSLSGARDLS
jgi:hypothetical protein